MDKTNANKLVAVAYKKFDNFFFTTLEDVSELETDLENEQLEIVKTWIERVCRFNVPHGKKLRLERNPGSINGSEPCKMPKQQQDEASLRAWMVLEILQASFLIADDIMDKSTMRRGKPCWYLVDDLGADAVNDSFLLEHIVYQLVKKHFKKTSYYSDLVDVFLQVTHKTVLGQCLDIQTGRNMQLEEYTMERYEAIVKYKTSFYTFYLPMKLAAIISDVENVALMDNLETLAMNIGYMFQVLDDYLDCYGSITKTGKIGTDIQNGKCSWLFVRSKELCSKEQLLELYDNYGQNDEAKIAHVIEIYEALNIPSHVYEFMKEMTTFNLRLINDLENDDLISLFKQLLEMVTENFGLTELIL
ncbi:unnamed protein product [Orchesella dallaii]|uniref:Farnesyl pyrophosphate synthase n=1 Tax=Orchesella dallaii TaxID=48710 RepID=A0ABP1RR88_9HEXA